MSTLKDSRYKMQHKGDHSVDFQSTRSDNSVPIEYHAFMTLEGTYLIERIDRTDAANVIFDYYFNQPHRSGVFETDWLARVTLPYVRYDLVQETFFSENNTSENPVV